MDEWQPSGSALHTRLGMHMGGAHGIKGSCGLPVASLSINSGGGWAAWTAWLGYAIDWFEMVHQDSPFASIGFPDPRNERG